MIIRCHCLLHLKTPLTVLLRVMSPWLSQGFMRLLALDPSSPPLLVTPLSLPNLPHLRTPPSAVAPKHRATSPRLCFASSPALTSLGPQEMNLATPGRTLTQQRKTAINFRDNSLFKVFQLALFALQEMLQKGADTRLKEQV